MMKISEKIQKQDKSTAITSLPTRHLKSIGVGLCLAIELLATSISFELMCGPREAFANVKPMVKGETSSEKVEN
jgi:hypothetical protein